MRRRLATITSVLTVTGGLTVAAIVATGTPAAAATVTVPLTCQTSGIPVVGTQVSTRDQLMTGTAPDHAYQNDVFDMSQQPAPDNLSPNAGSGATLNYVRDFRIHFAIPAN